MTHLISLSRRALARAAFVTALANKSKTLSQHLGLCLYPQIEIAAVLFPTFRPSIRSMMAATSFGGLSAGVGAMGRSSLLAAAGSPFGIQQQSASFSTCAATAADVNQDANGGHRDDDVLTTLPYMDSTFTDYNVTVSKITSPRQSQLALEYLTGSSNGQDDEDDSILARAGMIAIDLEGQLTLPQFAIPTSYRDARSDSSESQLDSESMFTGIHSVQIAVPLAHLAVHVPLNSLFTSWPQPPSAPQAEMRPPVHVFYWHLEPPHVSAADKHAMMQHIKAILHYPGCTTIAHCKTGDEQALFMQHGIHLRPPIVDTQRMYLQWTQLSWRLQKAWQVVNECSINNTTAATFGGGSKAPAFAVPPLNDRYLVPSHVPPPPPATSSSAGLPPPPDPHSTEGALHTSAIYTPLAESLGDPSAGLNDVLAACHLPINPLKKRSASKSDAAQLRYAVWDVAFLCQAYWHMATALAYLSIQLVSMQSLSPINLNSTHETSPWMGPLDSTLGSTCHMPPPPSDHPLVLAIAHLIHSLGQPTQHPSSLTSPAATTLAADLAAIESAFARKTTVSVRQRLNQRTGGVRQVIVDYPQYFRAWRVPSALDPTAVGGMGSASQQPVVWVSVVQMPPAMSGLAASDTASAAVATTASDAPAGVVVRTPPSGISAGKRKYHGYARAPRIKADLFGEQGAGDLRRTGFSKYYQRGMRLTHGVHAQHDVEVVEADMFDSEGNWIGQCEETIIMQGAELARGGHCGGRVERVVVDSVAVRATSTDAGMQKGTGIVVDDIL
ncbi:hypothetical protein BCR44DRAFT_178731 [Catenaria anguillulae PL171]|uniref:Uncharacterized protein n=1 Tax=Catenaria anguillulae PL171 TaxID=765915 RepID=A0A1Y2HC96_9FUNG|nr:hypothetical protein BCR44DRAFT_178731 [Catenaria anguillulae PL171]